MLEIKLNKIESPVVVFNYEELKKELEENLVKYKTYEVTESTITEAKDMRAKLNNLSKALNNKKKDVKNEILTNYTPFEDQVKKLIEMVDNASGLIDSQLKVFEEKRIEEKKVKIKEIFDSYNKIGIAIDKIYNSKWENKTVTLKAVDKEIQAIFEKINNEINLIDDYTDVPEEKQEILAQYLFDLDFSHAINTWKQKKKTLEEYKARKQREEELKQKYIQEVENKAAVEQKVVPSPITPTPVETPQEASKNDDKEDNTQWTCTIKCTGSVKELQTMFRYIKENNVKCEVLKDLEEVK